MSIIKKEEEISQKYTGEAKFLSQKRLFLDTNKFFRIESSKKLLFLFTMF